VIQFFRIFFWGLKLHNPLCLLAWTSPLLADAPSDVSALVDGSLNQLLRYNSTPDLLADSERWGTVAPEVTSLNANDSRSLHDVMRTTKVGGSSVLPPDGRSTNLLLMARTGLGGSTGNLVDTHRKSNARPPPPVRGLSTLSGYSDQQSRTSYLGTKASSTKNRGAVLESSTFNSGGRASPPAGHYSRQSRLNAGSGNTVESTSRLSKRFEGPTAVKSNWGPSVVVTAPRADQGNSGQSTMKRYGSEDNLLAPGSAVSPAQRDDQRQRLLSEELPPPPSPSSIVSIADTQVVFNKS